MSNLKIFLVGGAVRDRLLGLSQGELDWVVVGASPEEMLAAGYLKVGKDFPVFLHPATHEEYALARRERKTGKGYYGFECQAGPEVTLEEDLSRRDFTINAIAESLDGQLIDPYQGLTDLNNKIFRHVSKAFTEDPVRILRMARFAARFFPLGFKIADETWALMKHMVELGEVDALVPERVWKEMERALREKDPSQFFLVLRDCGALARLWPDLNKLWGIPQPEVHHPEIDTGLHVMMVLKRASFLSEDSVVRFAALCHDLGKGLTLKSEWPSHKGHEERGVPLIEAFCKKYKVPNGYKELAVLVSRFHLHCHRAFELRADTMIKTLERLDAFRNPIRFEKFLIACQADAQGRTGLEDKPYPQSDRMREAYQLAKAVDIKDLLEMGLQGAELGQKIYQKRVRVLEQAWK